jgi:hypothetical protein
MPTIFGIALVVLVATLHIWAATKPDTFRVECMATIKATLKKNPFFSEISIAT